MQLPAIMMLQPRQSGKTGSDVAGAATAKAGAACSRVDVSAHAGYLPLLTCIIALNSVNSFTVDSTGQHARFRLSRKARSRKRLIIRLMLEYMHVHRALASTCLNTMHIAEDLRKPRNARYSSSRHGYHRGPVHRVAENIRAVSQGDLQVVHKGSRFEFTLKLSIWHTHFSVDYKSCISRALTRLHDTE